MDTKYSLTVFVAVAALLSGGQPPGTASADTELEPPDAKVAEIRTLFTKYVDDFSHGRSKEISESIIQPPLLLGFDPPRTLSSATEVEAFYERAIAAIRGEGYDHSEILDLDVRLLNSYSAIVDLTYRRYKQDETIMGDPKRQGTYLVFLTSSGWRISALVTIRK